ncbi:hypothetical protein BO70DRAFT_168493 [Aspergillus heteromorphus CBS 117.55]|uniref:Uncharacterized protein n=1 Tax=Aspergillus heteromorphus CBS 117.55 TaxID=1448321 RepID=A0A317V405_9EURO|nr:uncharacterized protein BO70DRAFT_168493 [Aspergillus heteromorphus CBS 117.55]PWY67532.1 hypothetical protein BO70DRAFT_168493 [Aspergillus heteromorphus CBS 117.55]
MVPFLRGRRIRIRSWFMDAYLHTCMSRSSFLPPPPPPPPPDLPPPHRLIFSFNSSSCSLFLDFLIFTSEDLRSPGPAWPFFDGRRLVHNALRCDHRRRTGVTAGPLTAHDRLPPSTSCPALRCARRSAQRHLARLDSGRTRSGRCGSGGGRGG